MTKKEIGSAIGSLIVGCMLGLLIVLSTLGALGALDEEPGVNPFGDGQIFGASPEDPEAEPTPVPTPTEEELFEERKKWDSRQKLNPGNGMNQRDKTIETSKKKKKAERDDGVVEHRLPLLPIGGTLGTAFTHRCCDCALTHLVQITATEDAFGLPALALRWTRLERETEQARRLKWGLRWRQGQGPFPDGGGSMADPWTGR